MRMIITFLPKTHDLELFNYGLNIRVNGCISWILSRPFSRHCPRLKSIITFDFSFNMALMNILLIIFVTLLSHFQGSYSNDTDAACFDVADSDAKCWNYFECASCSILISTLDDVQCYGFGSCYNSSFDSSGNSFELYHVYCNGAYSCCNSSVEFPDSVSDHAYTYLQCDGLYSCSNSTFAVPFYSISCNGESSCAQIPLMNIMQSYHHTSYYDTSHVLTCDGFRSCDNSTFLVNNMKIYIRGYLGAVNSTFHSIYDSVYYYFYGVSSGYDSTIICYDDKKCYIECHNNACNKLNVQCIGMCNITFNCANAQRSDNCPNGYDVNANLLPDIDSMTISTYQNSFLPCNHSNSTYNNNNGVKFICNNQEECANQDLVSNENFNNQTICCTANYACNQSKNIINTGSNTRCDGKYSCAYIESMITNTNGNIYATGYGAMMHAPNVSGNVNLDFDIFCTGASSCENSTLSFANNVYCSGYYGCDGATIKFVNKVWGTGFESLYGTSLSDIFKNVYCLATYACFGAKIQNVAGKLVGFGAYTLREATIENVTDIICRGIGCLDKARIEGVNYINVDGMNSLNGAKIYSYKKENSQESFEMVINDTNDEKYSICCYKNSICKIICLSNNSCTNMKLYCESTCYIDCDESNSIDCPHVVYGDYVLWNSNITQSDTIFLTTTATTKNKDKNKNKNQLAGNDTIVVLIVTGSVILFVVVCVLIACQVKKRKNHNFSKAKTEISDEL